MINSGGLEGKNELGIIRRTFADNTEMDLKLDDSVNIKIYLTKISVVRFGYSPHLEASL